MVTYCWLLTVFMSTNAVIFAVAKLPHHCLNFITVNLILLEIVRTIILTYSGMKFVLCNHVIGDIFMYINYADKCFERSAIKVSHKRERMECSLYTAVIIIMFTIRTVVGSLKDKTQPKPDSFHKL